MVKDWNNATIMTVPSGLVTPSVTVRIYTRCDHNGIYTIIRCEDQYFILNEGKLPYRGNTWSTYKAYSMDNDREAMENAIRYARIQQETDMEVGIMNASIDAIFTGVLGTSGASLLNLGGSAVAGVAGGIAQTALGTALSIYESERNRDLKILQAQEDYQLTQKRSVSQPPANYISGYGEIYAYSNIINKLRVCVLTPNTITADYVTNWMDNYGYPCEGYHALTAQAGYYKGKLLNDGSLCGMYFDELNKDFMNGLKFITIT